MPKRIRSYRKLYSSRYHNKKQRENNSQPRKTKQIFLPTKKQITNKQRKQLKTNQNTYNTDFQILK